MTCKGSFEKILSIIVCDKKVLYFALEHKIKIYPFVGSDTFANKGFSCPYAISRYAVFTNTRFREEMRNFQGSRNGVQSLLDRTRTSIRESSFSSASDLRNDRTTAISPSSNSSGLSAFVSRASPSSTSNQCLTMPGHPYRPLRRKTQKEIKATVTPKAVHLIEARKKLHLNMSDSEVEDVAEESTLSFHDSMVILKGEFDLVSGHTEDQIRQELVDVFKTK